jgi:hypothetical protein
LRLVSHLFEHDLAMWRHPSDAYRDRAPEVLDRL